MLVKILWRKPLMPEDLLTARSSGLKILWVKMRVKILWPKGTLACRSSCTEMLWPEDILA